MKSTLFLGIAAAGLMVGAPVALASGQSSSSQTSSSQTPSSSSSASQTPSSSSSSTPSSSSKSGMSASSSSSESSQLSGKIESVDQQNKSVTISEDSGKTQSVKVGDSTTITRDGSSVSFSELKPGDQVRASLDPTTHQATTLEVTKQKSK